MSYRVVILGLGQLGSRYLQGLSSTSVALEIIGLDPSVEATDRARSRWEEVSVGSHHRVDFVTTIDALPDSIDLAIVSCSARERVDVITEVLRAASVDAWILEKYLAQSREGLDRIDDLLGSQEHVWVNLPYRVMSIYQCIKASIPEREPISVGVAGDDFGVMTNSIHFVDLVAWWRNTRLTSILFQPSSRGIVPAKRHGYVDSNGSVVAEYEDGSRATIESRDIERGQEPRFGIDISLESSGFSAYFSEKSAEFRSSRGHVCRGRVELQSEMTKRVVEQILSTRTSQLPNLNSALQTHALLLDAFQKEWNKYPGHTEQIVQVT